MRLVDDDRVVGAKKRIGASLREKNAVGHELDARQVGDFSPEAVLVADDAADGRLQFLRNALCNRDGGEAARLGACDAPAVLPASELHRHFRELRRLSGARVAADDDDGVLFHERKDFLPMFADRKFFLVVELNLAAVHADDIIPFRVKFVTLGSPGM